MNQEIVFGLVPLVVSVIVFVLWQGVGAARSARNQLALREQALDHSQDMSLLQRERVISVLRKATASDRYRIARLVLFGSLVHDNRTPSDIDIMAQLLPGTNIRREASLISREVGSAIEVFGLPVQWEWFTSGDREEADRFIENCLEGGGFIQVWPEE